MLAGQRLAIGGIGWAPIVIGLGYVLGMRLIHVNRTRADSPAAADRGSSGERLRGPMIGFAASTAVILLTAPMLASSGSELAQKWGIASGFFGMVFLAAATSLPEVAVVGAALRAGAYTLAVGNLFGSNCFNMLILPVLDVVDGSSSLLAEADAGVAVGAVFAMVLAGQALLDLLNRSERRIWYLEPGPGLIVLTYAAGLYLTYGATH